MPSDYANESRFIEQLMRRLGGLLRGHYCFAHVEDWLRAARVAGEPLAPRRIGDLRAAAGLLVSALRKDKA